MDIDIRAISSHAQAEALVQRAQKSILDMQLSAVDLELPPLGSGSGSNGPPTGALASASANAGAGAGAGWLLPPPKIK